MGGVRKHGQEDVEDRVLEVLESGAVTTTQQITRHVRAELNLLPGDLQPANERPNEQVIDQIIANALQAKRRLSAEGLIERVGRGEFRITEKGRAYLLDRRASVAEWQAFLPDDL